MTYAANGNARRHLPARPIPSPLNWWHDQGPVEKVVAAVLVVSVLLLLCISIYESTRPNFTIHEGQDLQSYLPIETSIKVAETAHRPIWTRLDQHSSWFVIAPEQARKLDTHKYPLWVLVRPGDRFDLRWGIHFTPARPSRGA